MTTAIDALKDDLSRPQLSFDVDGLTLKAQQWGDPDGEPVLALHGWLDNSASFYRLAPLLKGLNIIALDMAGHGFSDHRPGRRPYNIWEDVSEIISVVDQLDWDTFSMLGHSRGAIMSMLTAGAFPERVKRIGLIEGMWPPAVSAADSPQQLAQSIRDSLRVRKTKVYESIDDLITARMNGRFPLSEASANALTKRGYKKTDGGYTWSTDASLMNASAFKLTEEHIQAFIKRITMPVQLIATGERLDAKTTILPEFLEHFKACELIELKGTHHLHMEEQADLMAGRLNTFLLGR